MADRSGTPAQHPLPSDEASAAQRPAAPRLFIEMPLASGLQLALPEDAVRHVQVLRLSPPADLTLFNGSGGEYRAQLTDLGRKHATASVGDFVAREAEPPYRVVLAQGIAGGDKMDWLIEKAVELGVAGVVPLIAARGVVRLSAERAARRQHHWQALVRAACEQCGRNRPPEVAAPVSYAAWLQGAALTDAGARYVLSPRATGGLEVFPAHPPVEPVVVLIGPEAGLSEHEEAQALDEGFVPVSLGPRILRTETAGLALLAALAARWSGF